MTVAYVYPHATSILAGGFTWTSATINVALLTQLYVPSGGGTEQYLSDVNTYEVSGAGYTAGGVTLTSKTSTFNASTRTTILSATNPQWASLTATYRYAVFYISTGTAATSQLISYMDFETSRSSSAQITAIILPASGVVTIQGM